MPVEGANFTSYELQEVLRQYDIGNIIQIKTLAGGNTAAPKKIILTDRGKFLLKRRTRDKNDVFHVAFAHSLQMHLESKKYPVAGLIPTVGGKTTIVHLSNHTYELFHFVPGSRYDGAKTSTHNAALALARLHTDLLDFKCERTPLRRTFHDSPSVRGHLKTVSSKKNKHTTSDLQAVAVKLNAHYNQSSAAINQFGFDSWPEQAVHGDWHPGNMLFTQQKVVCVLDFDSAKIAPAVTDVASGLLHFSIVAGRPSPADWPAYPDQAKIADFLAGYTQKTELTPEMLKAMPDLIIEIMVAEAVLPVAATGFFGHFSGIDFLNMICRKCDWIDKNRQLLNEVLSADSHL